MPDNTGNRSPPLSQRLYDWDQGEPNADRQLLSMRIIIIAGNSHCAWCQGRAHILYTPGAGSVEGGSMDGTRNTLSFTLNMF